MTNPSFSTVLPTLQLHIDSTSLSTFKECPRKYYLSMLASGHQTGYQPRHESVHLTFGLILHGAVERYHHHRNRPIGQGWSYSHDGALLQVVKWAMCETWDRDLGRPKASLSFDKIKNRFTLIRTIVCYLDEFRDDPIRTVTLRNGKQAVELSFTIDSGYTSRSTGEPFRLCGHLDRIGRLSNQNYIIDIKTTQNTITSSWFDTFTPDNQMTLYTIAGKTAFGVETEGLIVDGIQVTMTGFVERGSPFERQPIPRSPHQLEEWHQDLEYWLDSLDTCAARGQWPQNDKSCNHYWIAGQRFGGCPFRPVCYAPSPEARSQVLAGLYTPRMWNPLQHRGDI